MSKYSPLGDFLQAQQISVVPMSFADVERVIGISLPPSSKYPAWWSNNSSNNVMTEIWLKAGFQTERVDVHGQKLVFRRVRGNPKIPHKADDHLRQNRSAAPGTAHRHPIFGCMKGTITIALGVDLTDPVDPSWGADA